MISRKGLCTSVPPIRVSAADEDAGAAFAEESQRLIAIVAEAQVPSGNDGLVTRRGAFNVD